MMTNGDMIRQMNNEELSEFIDEIEWCRICPHGKIEETRCIFTSVDQCKQGIKYWLGDNLSPS